MTEPAVPGVGEIARQIALAMDVDPDVMIGMQGKLPAYLTDAARAVLDLFAPILAEKERLERILDLTRQSRVRWFASTMHEQRKREAAEAALAGERERCANRWIFWHAEGEAVFEYINGERRVVVCIGDGGIGYTYKKDGVFVSGKVEKPEDNPEEFGAEIAAAIRAQGE